jgi:hypothetical protein
MIFPTDLDLYQPLLMDPVDQASAELAPADLASAELPPPAGAPVAGASALDLPMMVWLRGDEEFCADFSLEAEEVMLRLGIRRSRLTQISGKELRVGRMRKGRYVSPVFRPADVEAYLNWTRASASHQKSSGLLHDAAEELMQQSARLGERLEVVPQELAAAVHARITRATLELTSVVEASSARLGGEFQLLEAGFRDSEGRIKLEMAQQTILMGSLRAQLDAQQLLLQIITREVGEMAAHDRSSRAEGKAFAQDLWAQQEALRLDLREVLQAATTRPSKTSPPSRAALRRITMLAARDLASAADPAPPASSLRALKAQARAGALARSKRRRTRQS